MIMSYTDLRDFVQEYETITDDGVRIQLEKLGGGTVGRRYQGFWRYIVTDSDGLELCRGQDFQTGFPRTHEGAARDLAELLDTPVTHVWSKFGHRFYSHDGAESCMTCGARFNLVWRGPGDPSGGDYKAANGDDPVECSGDTGQVHGEAPCMSDECDHSEPCSHESHDCNCLLCTG